MAEVAILKYRKMAISLPQRIAD